MAIYVSSVFGEAAYIWLAGIAVYSSIENGPHPFEKGRFKVVIYLLLCEDGEFFSIVCQVDESEH